MDASALQAIFGYVRANWVLYASMPLVASAIGYVTKVAAI